MEPCTNWVSLGAQVRVVGGEMVWRCAGFPHKRHTASTVSAGSRRGRAVTPFVGSHGPALEPCRDPEACGAYEETPRTSTYLPHPPRFEPTLSRDNSVGSWSRVPTGYL
ncbi:hypothetical protein Syun_012183 [Stephania yunnanensis]|uniref:Uncharacterized protein n=1 Tax=Stephania yunnanensis TaxID=152371 RepID=A0AAP0JYY1_9MAGN